MRSQITVGIIGAALIAGALIAFADTRPGWDDTGITAGALILASAALSFARPRMAIVIALCVGGWIPLLEIRHNSGSILALGVALIGALCGAGLRAMMATVPA